MYEELFIRTQYDEKDYRSVLEIYHYDENGEEELEALTDMCMDVSTCADQGHDTWSWIKDAVAARLDSAGFSYSSISFDDDEPCM